jgi:hypothetical protein
MHGDPDKTRADGFLKIRPGRFRLARAILASLYLALGLMAAWHAPHDLGHAPLQYAAHTCADSGHPFSEDPECALCSWQSLHQDSVASVAVKALDAQASRTSRPRPESDRSGFEGSRWPRGPPSA